MKRARDAFTTVMAAFAFYAGASLWWMAAQTTTTENPGAWGQTIGGLAMMSFALRAGIEAAQRLRQAQS